MPLALVPPVYGLTLGLSNTRFIERGTPEIPVTVVPLALYQSKTVLSGKVRGVMLKVRVPAPVLEIVVTDVTASRLVELNVQLVAVMEALELMVALPLTVMPVNATVPPRSIAKPKQVYALPVPGDMLTL